MQRYMNYGGNSNVVFYEISSNSIVVQFGDGSSYLYDYNATGMSEVEHMKKLALDGIGLNSYIKRVVNKIYAYRIR